jgi:hypothetical protein
MGRGIGKGLDTLKVVACFCALGGGKIGAKASVLARQFGLQISHKADGGQTAVS